jgi:hypothetical protein
LIVAKKPDFALMAVPDSPALRALQEFWQMAICIWCVQNHQELSPIALTNRPHWGMMDADNSSRRNIPIAIAPAWLS